MPCGDVSVLLAETNVTWKDLAWIRDAWDGPLVVNSYHHQGIRPRDLAPGLVASAWADSSAGPLIEGLEATDGRFIIGVQCHPERTESTPDEFEQLFATFVDACRT